MRAEADERLGREGAFRGAAAAPGSAVDEDADRRMAILRSPTCGEGIGGIGTPVDIEALMLARPVGDTLRCAKDFSRPLARGGDSPNT